MIKCHRFGLITAVSQNFVYFLIDGACQNLIEISLRIYITPRLTKILWYCFKILSCVSRQSLSASSWRDQQKVLRAKHISTFQ